MRGSFDRRTENWSRMNKQIRNRAARSAAAVLLLLLAAPAPAALPPAGAALERSDAGGLSLTLRWDPSEVSAGPDGTVFALTGCRQNGAAGGPMLPRYSGLIALPPGTRASLSWRVLASEALPGEPAPFPTIEAIPAEAGRPLFRELPLRVDAEYASPRLFAADLGAATWLRDQRVVDLIVDPVAWSQAGGLRLATAISVEIRFVPADDREEAGRELLTGPDPLWAPIYRAAIVNGAAASDWARRRPAARETGPRATPVLRLRLATSGVYGLDADDLIARGIPAGTPLGDIALWSQTFEWDEQGQYHFDQVGESRFFLDPAGDGDLDPGDTMVFLGRRLRDQPDGVDALEWYGRASALWVGIAPELSVEMATESGWQEGTHLVPTTFSRSSRVYGEGKFFANPPSRFYVPINQNDQNPPPNADTWRDNLYYFRQPSLPADPGWKLVLDLPCPALAAGERPELSAHWQGEKREEGDLRRRYELQIINANGTFDLPEMSIVDKADSLYAETLAAGVIMADENSLSIKRHRETPGESPVWNDMMKYWELDYESEFEARNDSLLFHAQGLSGDTEFRIGGFSAPRTGWILLRGGELPSRIALGAENQAGVPGDYELRFRASVTGEETWWALDSSRLLSPGIETPASQSALSDAGPYDVLVIAHDDFVPGMQRWVEFREEQGYRVKMLSASEVWESFHSGCRGPVGMRNAARFAYSEWGAAALVLVGDSNKDSRLLDYHGAGDPDFLPGHSIFEAPGGIEELVQLDEWVAVFEPVSWPSLLMGRLPVGSADELEILLDKIECYENYTDGGGCNGAGDWRARFLMIADDCWSWTDTSNPCATCHPHERNFQVGQESAMAIVATSIPGDIFGVPFFVSAISDDWYANWLETHACAHATDLQSILRPLLYPVLVDSLSQGYGMATVQSHADRDNLGHAFYFDVEPITQDHLGLTNWGQPFFWVLFGCHGNAFANYNERNIGDSMGEKLLFLDGGRGAVASWASEGFEYLNQNVTFGNDQMEVMFWADDSPNGLDVFPDWRLGSIERVTEMRYGLLYSSYRMNLLGDPLSRLDASPPRIDLFVDGRRMVPGDFLPAASTGDTLRVEALVYDETYITDVAVRDENLGHFQFEKRARRLPSGPDGLLLVNVDAPAAPIIEGRLDTPGNSWAVQSNGTTVYMAEGEAGVRAISRNAPLAPSIRWTVDTPGYASGVAFSGAKLFVADGPAGLQVVDAPSAGLPGLIGSLAVSGGANAVAVSGGYAFIASGAGLFVADVSSPAAPRRVASLSLPACRDIALAGTLAALADSAGNAIVVDIADPAAPVHLATLALAGNPTGLALSGDLLFVAAGGSGLIVVDLATAAAPVVVGAWDSPGYAWDVALAGGYAYVADGLAGLQILSIADPSDPVPVGELALPGMSYARGIEVIGGIARIAYGVGPIEPLLAHSGLSVLDLTVPVDSIAAAESDRSRAWYLSASIPYDFRMEGLLVEGVDLARRTGAFELLLAKTVTFRQSGEGALREGQWVRSAGEFQVRILVPSPEILPSSFSLREDGVARSEIAETTAEDLVYEMRVPYSWSPGEHSLELLFDGERYGFITLNVDARARLLEGQIFPNPFRSVATFRYLLSGAISEGSLSIYTLSGRRIHREALTDLGEGVHHYAVWDGLDDAGDKVANGVYISRIVFRDPSGESLVWEDRVVRMR